MKKKGGEQKKKRILILKEGIGPNLKRKREGKESWVR